MVSTIIILLGIVVVMIGGKLKQNVRLHHEGTM